MSRKSIKQLKSTQLRPTSDDKEAGLFYSELEVGRRTRPVGRVTYAGGEEQIFTDSQTYLDTIREELPYRDTTGFRHETLTNDPSVQKAVDDILLNFSGEGNPRRECSYGLTDAGKQALQNAAGGLDHGKEHDGEAREAEQLGGHAQGLRCIKMIDQAENLRGQKAHADGAGQPHHKGQP